MTPAPSAPLWLIGKTPFGRCTLFFHPWSNRVVFWRRPQIRLLYTHPLACNPRRLPHELGWCVYSDAIQALGNAKGTLCKGEITTAKSLLSFSLSLWCSLSLMLSLSPLPLSCSQTGGKIALAQGRKPWKREADALWMVKTLKEKTFIQFSRPVLKAHLYCIVPNATSLF